jgi:hypothetical protein
MAVDSNKIYQIQLTTTGSDVEPTDQLVLLLSGSGTVNFLTSSISDSVTNWQAGQELSGSVLISEYNTALFDFGVSEPEGSTVFAARLRNEDGACDGELSGIVVFPGVGCNATLIESSIGFAESSEDLCSTGGTSGTFYSNNGEFSTDTTILYSDENCTAVDPGYYGTLSGWIQVDESGQKIDSGSCDI